MEAMVATSVPGIVFGNGGRCPEVFPTSLQLESLAYYFSGESVPRFPGSQSSSCLGD